MASTLLCNQGKFKLLNCINHAGIILKKIQEKYGVKHAGDQSVVATPRVPAGNETVLAAASTVPVVAGENGMCLCLSFLHELILL